MKELLSFSIGDPGNATSISLPKESNVNSLLNDSAITSHFFQTFFNALIFIAVLLAFGFIIFEGYRYMVSQGDKKEIETARASILNAVIGIIIILTSFFVVNLVGYFFHINLLKTVFIQ